MVIRSMIVMVGASIVLSEPITLSCHDPYHHASIGIPESNHSKSTAKLLCWAYAASICIVLFMILRQLDFLAQKYVPFSLRSVIVATFVHYHGLSLWKGVIFVSIAVGRVVFRHNVHDVLPLYRLAEIFPPDPHSLPDFAELQASDFDPGKMREYTKGYTRGIIVRGLSINTPACHKWSFEWLKGFRNDYALLHHHIASSKPYNYEQLMKFSRMIDDHQRNQLSPDVNCSMFGISDFRFLIRNREVLLNDVALQTLITKLYDVRLLQSAFSFQFNVHKAPLNGDVCDARGFGWHSAPGWNLATLARGAKNWTFASRKNLIYLRPYHIPLGTFWSYWGHMPKEDEGDKGRYEEVPTLTITQKPGDVIYFPAWVPHKTAQIGVKDANNEVMLVTYRGLNLQETLFADFGVAISFGFNMLGHGNARRSYVFDYVMMHLGFRTKHEVDYGTQRQG